MKTNKEILSSILKTTQMGQVGIRSVQKQALGEDMKLALRSQLKEYDAIEREAHEIASQRGWVLPELNAGVRVMSDMMSRAMLMTDRSDSKIAGMMIQGNTRGVIKGLKNLHQFTQQDSRVAALSLKLLDCENANIRQMEDFL